MLQRHIKLDSSPVVSRKSPSLLVLKLSLLFKGLRVTDQEKRELVRIGISTVSPERSIFLPREYTVNGCHVP